MAKVGILTFLQTMLFCHRLSKFMKKENIWKKKNKKNREIKISNFFFLDYVFKYSFCNNIIINQKVKTPTLATLFPEALHLSIIHLTFVDHITDT